MTKEQEKMIENIKKQYEKELQKVKDYYAGLQQQLDDQKFEIIFLKRDKERQANVIKSAYAELNHVGFLSGASSRQRALEILKNEIDNKK